MAVKMVRGIEPIDRVVAIEPVRPLLVVVYLLTGCARPEVCPDGVSPGSATPATPSAEAGYLVFAHAHNDYEHERPLLDALDQGFYSVEADLWLRDGEIIVAHNCFSNAGSLRELYLDPLQARVDEKGSVHGDGERFTLWLDLKEGRKELRDALHQLLERYSMLSSFEQDRVSLRAVTAVLTGDHDSKVAFCAELPGRRACRDSNNFSLDDPRADSSWRHYALNWGSYVDWDGEGEIGDGERERLRCLVDQAHASGRRIRFWAAPDTEAFWRLALEEGVDYINTDRLDELSAFLRSYAP